MTIRTKAATDEYRDNWERIFGKKREAEQLVKYIVLHTAGEGAELLTYGEVEILDEESKE